MENKKNLYGNMENKKKFIFKYGNGCFCLDNIIKKCDLKKYV